MTRILHRPLLWLLIVLISTKNCGATADTILFANLPVYIAQPVQNIIKIHTSKYRRKTLVAS